VNEPLLLLVPEQHDYRNPVVELNPKRLGRWLKQLPLVNLCSSLEQVLDALAPCNLQAMAGKNRIRLLELYRDTFGLLFDAADEQHLSKLPISPDQRERARELTAALCAELAIGYKILVRECLRSQAPAGEPLLAPALYRAAEATALGLLHSYRTYQPSPAYAYLELHRLYGLAERTGVADAPVIFEKQLLSEAGIGAEYRRILMLAVADPYRFGAGAAARLFPLLARYAPLCRLEPWQPGTHPDGCFVIDRGADSAPRAAALGEPGYDYEDPMLFDIRPALDAIAESLAGLSEDSPEDERMLQLLVPDLQRKRIRHAPRRDVRREAWVTFGIASVHFFLERGPAHLSEAIRAAGTGFQVLDLEAEADAGHGVEPWVVVNESVSGYLLASRNRWEGEPRVGEIVGAAIPGANSTQPRLTVAAVRWMRAARDQRVEMGVEIVPGIPRAIRCTDAAGRSLGGLFFPSAPALQLPATLVLPKGIYRPGAAIGIQTEERTLQVRAGDLVAETPCFDRFDFTSG